jgi:hypothetical protein
MAKRKTESEFLKGWQETVKFLGQPVSTAQRWARSGMPVTRKGRFMYASPEELNRWLGRESAGEPVQIATETADLAADLMRGLSYVRKHGRGHKKQTSAPLRKKRR